jgi:hypothetical protein
MDIILKDIYGNNCLLLTCCENPNINIIKYLINDCKMEINIK